MVVSFLAANGTQAAPSTQFASSVKEGMLVYDDTNDALKLCDGTSWIALQAGTVSAAGTVTGAVQFRGATGVFAADDVNFIWEDTNNRLGIGTATPAQPLHVNSTAAGSSSITGVRTLLMLENNVAWGAPSINFKNDTTNGDIKFGSGTNAGTITQAFFFNIGGSNAFLIDDAAAGRILAAGRLGLGYTDTVNPAVRFNSASSSEPGVLELTFNPDASGYLKIGKEGSGSAVDELMRVTAAGNIGIGTTSPDTSALLDITSTTKGFLPPRMQTSEVSAIGTPADGLLVYDTDTDTIKLRANGAWVDLAFGAGGGGTTAAAGNAGEVQFNDGAGALTADSNLFWDNTNNRLGIGGTPTNPLTVQSATITPLFISRNESDNNSRWVAGFVRTRADATAPLADFGGVLSFGLETFTDGTVRYPAGIKWGWEVDQTNDTTDRDSYLVFTTTADDTSAGTGGVEQMRITSRGNVGIGTSAPDAKLHVAGGVKIGDDSATCPGVANVKLGTLRFNSGNFEVCQSGGWASASGGASGVGADGYVQVSDGAGGLTTSGSTAGEQLFWDNTNKRLGIGTATPANRLEVYGNSMRNAARASTTAGGVTIEAQSSDYWSTPTYMGTGLWQYGSAAAGNTFGIANAGLGLLNFQNGTSAVIGTNGGTPLIFATLSTERMRITSAGNVGIGTTTPAASSLLDLTSTTKGLLPPRMTSAQRDAIASPAAGLEIYNTTTNQPNYFNGTAWTVMGSGGGGNAGIWSAVSTGQVENTGATGPTMQDIPGLSITFTLAEDAKVLAIGNGSIRTDAGGGTPQVGLAFTVDGTVQGHSQWGQQIEGIDGSGEAHAGFTITNSFTLPAGSHTIKLGAAPYGDIHVCAEGGGGIVDYKKCRLQLVAIPDSGGGGGGSSATANAGYLQISDGSTLTDSGTAAGQQLFWDNTNKRLGIGTASPTHVLDITGASTRLLSGSDYVITHASLSGDPTIQMFNSGSVDLRLIAVSAGLQIGGPSAFATILTSGASFNGFVASPIIRANDATNPYVRIWKTGVQYYDFNASNSGRLDLLNTSGDPLATFLSTGNVGIGTTSPNAAALLDVTSTTKGFAPPRMTTAQVTAIATPPDGLMAYDTDTDTIKLRSNGAWVSLASGSGGSSQWTTAGSDIYYNSGNIGIGTTNPSAYNDLGNDFVIQRSGNAGMAIIGTGAGGNNSTIFFGDDESEITGAIVYAHDDDSMQFKTNGFGERMRITSAGNVGIGTTLPGSKLTVSANGATLPSPLSSDVASFANADATTTRVTLDAFGASGNLTFRSSGGTATAPSGLAADGEIGRVSWFGYGQTGYASGARAALVGRAAENWTDTEQGTYLTFNTTSAGSTSVLERMRIDAAGNVGIGTTTPSSQLHVKEPLSSTLGQWR